MHIPKPQNVMRRATILAVLLLFAGSVPLSAQVTDFVWIPSQDGEYEDTPFFRGFHSGARTVVGPYDVDDDGKMEFFVSDYSGGARFHMFENTDTDTWELVFSSSWIDSTGTTNNIRSLAVGDLDGDGKGEVMALAGRGISEHNPLAPLIEPGLYVLESDGDDEFGALPSVYTFEPDVPDRWRAEQMTVVDIDGDGNEELLFGNNGSSNEFDNWYILSVTGDLGSTTGVPVWNVEARWSSRAAEDFDPVNRGGGSPYGMIPANLDGGDDMEIAMQSWNNFNFTNARATDADTYETIDEDTGWYHASTSDHVALFGCVAVDMDDDGDDEVYCPNLQTGDVAILNYESGEDALTVGEDNVVLDLIPGLSALGITAGDIDMDEQIELIGSGPGYFPGNYNNGDAPQWISIADFEGGDVEDPDNYSVRLISFPDDNVNQFDTVNRDSLGTMSTYLEVGQQGHEFTSKLAFLGDPDDDDHNELVFATQGVDDTLYVYDEVWDVTSESYTRTVSSAEAHGRRAFVRVFSGDGLTSSFTEERVVLPSDYVLHSNYPNPFNPSTTFSFTLPLDKQISVHVYDLTGRRIRTLINNERFTQGTHRATWDGLLESGLPAASGTYIYTLEYGNFMQSRKMLLIK